LLQTDRSLRCAIAVLFTIASFLDGPILLDAINVWFSPNSVQSVVLNGHLRVTHGRGGTSASVVADDKVGAIAFGHNVRSVALEAFEYPLRASSDAATPLSVRVNIHQGFFGRPFVVSHELVSGRRK
jgi:hypothetical protein